MVVARRIAISRQPTEASEFVRRAFARSPYALALRNIQVEDREGAVALTGGVRSFYFKQIAQQLALAHACGEVVNEIEVEGFRRTGKGR